MILKSKPAALHVKPDPWNEDTDHNKSEHACINANSEILLINILEHSCRATVKVSQNYSIIVIRLK